MCRYFVYIMARGKNGTLYIGVTSNVYERARQHKLGLIKGFTEKYGPSLLVYVEETDDVAVAIQREKRLKEWRRVWKLELIESVNPEWLDLTDGLE